MKLSVLSLWTGQRGTDTLGLPESTRTGSLTRPPPESAIDFHAPESSSTLGGTTPPKTVRTRPALAQVG